MPARALQGKCEVHKGLLLHVDAPVKQFILDLNTKHCHHIVINSLPNDDRKIFVSREFEDASGHEQDTLAFLQVCVRRVGAERRGACVARPPQHADTGRCSVAAGPARPPSGKHYIQPGRRAMKVQRSYRRMRCTASLLALLLAVAAECLTQVPRLHVVSTPRFVHSLRRRSAVGVGTWHQPRQPRHQPTHITKVGLPALLPSSRAQFSRPAAVRAPGGGGSGGAGAARELGFSFSVAGLIFPYFLGVIAELKDAGILTEGTPLAGSSGGALAAAFTALGLDDETVLEATYRVCAAIRKSGKSSRGRLGRLLKQELVRVLPEDAHERLNAWEGGVRIGVTLLLPAPTAVYIDKFKSKEDVVEVLSASCHIPFWCSNWPFTRCRGTLGADGYVLEIRKSQSSSGTRTGA
jgi:hypothetical protein